MTCGELGSTSTAKPAGSTIGDPNGAIDGDGLAESDGDGLAESDGDGHAESDGDGLGLADGDGLGLADGSRLDDGCGAGDGESSDALGDGESIGLPEGVVAGGSADGSVAATFGTNGIRIAMAASTTRPAPKIGPTRRLERVVMAMACPCPLSLLRVASGHG